MTKAILLTVIGWSVLAAGGLPIGGISHAGFRIADLEKTRAFYTGVLGFQQAFGQKDASGKTTLAVFKINEDQFLEFSPGVPAGTVDRFTHIAFLTEKLESLRQLVEGLGLNPPELRTGHDRTRNFSIHDPDGHRVEFVEYEPDSMHAEARGKFADSRRISTHLLHVGLSVSDRNRALDFFRGSLGFTEVRPGLVRPPGAMNDFVELLPQGTGSHLCFEVTNLKEAMRTLQERGLAAGEAIHDPDGTPIELAQRPR